MGSNTYRNELKVFLVEHLELVKEQSKVMRNVYSSNSDYAVIDYVNRYGKDVFDVANSINNSRYHKIQRCKSKISKLVTKDKCLFLTITFKDSVLSKTSMQTRRRYVSRYLKSVSDNYVANIDFGKTNGREHYHAIVKIVGELNYADWQKKYGAINGRVIKNNETDAIRTIKYINKLTNHSFKDSTAYGKVSYRLIYSRKPFKIN